MDRFGRLTVTPSVVECDLIAGRNRIKLIGLEQFGLTLDALGLTAGTLALEDAVGVVRAYLTMCDAVGLGVSRVTAPQVGWMRFKSHHMPPVLSVNTDPEVRSLERRAHYVGRNEAFRLGDVPGITYSLDIKSCYANVCVTRELPVHMVSYYDYGIDLGNIDPEGRDHWIAECVVRTPSADYPVRYGGVPIYPVGEYHTALCWPELRHAIGHGRVRRITRAARYLARPACRSYAEWYLASRDRLAGCGMAALVGVLKATFNSSLGYSARKGRDWLRWEIDPPWRWWVGVTEAPDHSAPCVQARVLDGCPEWLSIGAEPYESLPMLHATICSWARVQLLEIFDHAGRENILYCDTDGILTNAAGHRRITGSSSLCGESPGQLVTRFAAGAARIAGQKNYRVGVNFVCAGGAETRRSLTADRVVYTTPTGRTDVNGVVSPFEFECADEGDSSAHWVNRMTGVP